MLVRHHTMSQHATTSSRLCEGHWTKPSSWEKNSWAFFYLAGLGGWTHKMHYFCLPNAAAVWEAALYCWLNLCKSPRRHNWNFHGPFFQLPGRSFPMQTNKSHCAAITRLLHMGAHEYIHWGCINAAWLKPRFEQLGVPRQIPRAEQQQRQLQQHTLPESLLSCCTYPSLALQTVLQLRDLIVSFLILGGGFNENSRSWGTQEFQLSFKTN